jgi:hypothetical protein
MHHVFLTSAAERLATVVRCRASGRYGDFTDLDFGRCRVTGEGFDAFVTPGINGWVVAAIGAPLRPVAVHADLEEAARLALNP